LAVLRTVELDRKKRRLVSSRNDELVMRLESELIKRLLRPGALDGEDIR
jgi:hypothetical protein